MLLLQTTSNIYIVKISAVFRPLKINTIIKRTMLRNAFNHTNNLVRLIHFQGFSQRNYPGKFKAVYYDKKEHPISGSGKSIQNHETFHAKLQEVATGKIYGGFTSHPKAGDPNYQYISEERLDGTIDSTTGQWFGIYRNPKTVSSPEIVKEVPENQAYVDKNESKFEAIAQAKKDAICDDRTSRQDSRFYNEDGTRDYDNFGGKW